MVRVLFICLGNICRSPIAEAVFQNLVEQSGLHEKIVVDSAGTAGYHSGESPCPGTQHLLKIHHLPYNGRARQITPRDLIDFDYLIALDAHNQSDVEAMLVRHGIKKPVYRLLDFAENTITRDVPDPYYVGNFDRVYQLVQNGCDGLHAYLTAADTL